MKNMLLLSASLLTMFIGCMQKKGDNNRYVVTKDGQGNIISEINYIRDTVVNGVAKYYYKNGNLKDEINYVNGFKYGIHKHYTPNGLLESEIEFKNDTQDGYAYWYYINGKVESKSFWINGKTFGDAYYYYDTGILESYRSFDYQGHIRYLTKYDSSGLKIKEEGTVLGQLVIDGDFNSVPLTKNVTFRICVANPPNTNTKVVLKQMKDNTMLNIRELPINKNEATYVAAFNVIGKYKLVTVGEMKDLRDNLIKQDTIYTDITVIE